MQRGNILVIAILIVVAIAGGLVWVNLSNEADNAKTDGQQTVEESDGLDETASDEEEPERTIEDDFSITLAAGWSRAEGQASQGTIRYVNGDATLDIVTDIKGREYPGDVMWYFETSADGSVSALHDKMIFCEQDAPFCGTGSGGLSIVAVQVDDYATATKSEDPHALILASIADDEDAESPFVADFSSMIESLQFTN